HRARFRVRESTERIEIVFTSLDGTAHASVKARPASDLPGGSVFGDLTEASAFFRTAPLGYSATRRDDRLDSVELACPSWKIQPLVVESVECSFFDDPEVFPSGAAEFDSALLMRDIPAAWLGHAPLRSARS